MTDSPEPGGLTLYRVPRAYPTVFYTLLAIWTLAFVPVAIAKAAALGAGLWLMIACFVAYSWYWSLGIAYMIQMQDDGSMQFISGRGRIYAHCREIERIEGPPSPIRFGVLRFGLRGQRTYLFLARNGALQRILLNIQTANPQVRLKGL